MVDAIGERAKRTPRDYDVNRPITSLAERLWRRVNKAGPLWYDTPCWAWTGCVKQGGYGQIGRGRKLEGTGLVHVLAFEMLVGPVPEGKQIDHLCRNPRCVNPAHLEAVTGKTNVLRSQGVTAQNARKTSCIHGHEYTPANTISKYRGGRFSRECRTCENAAQRIRAKRRAQRAVETVRRIQERRENVA